jgi:hypothetical protein
MLGLIDASGIAQYSARRYSEESPFADPAGMAALVELIRTRPKLANVNIVLCPEPDGKRDHPSDV